MTKLIDIPPIWLVGSLVLSYWIGRIEPVGLGFGPVWPQWLGGLLVGAGISLMALAVFEMRRVRTTVIPHLPPNHLVYSGIFGWSRNPIYLGDILVLAGMILHWEAVFALPLVIVFKSILQSRFVFAEEKRLEAAFGEAFSDYCQKVRRWV